MLDEQHRDSAGQRAQQPAKRALSAGDIPAAGSSSSSSRGRQASASATSSCWRSPCDSAATGASARAASPTAAEQLVGLARGPRRRPRAQQAMPTPAARWAAERDGLVRRHRREQAGVLQGLAHADPGPARLGQTGDVPAVQRDRPASGRIVPAISLNRVDLPAPFGPIRACRAPAATARSTPSTALSAPNEPAHPVQRNSSWRRLAARPGSRSPANPRGSR